MRRTKEEAEKTRKQLLDAALQVFSKKGYEATKLSEIAQTANVTRGAIYHHFENKTGLYEALLIEASSVANEIIQKATIQGGSLKEILHRILLHSFQTIEENRRFRDVMMLVLFKTGASDELNHLIESQKKQTEQTIQGITEYMRQAAASGDLRDGVSPETAAHAFISYQNGVMSLWLTNPDGFSIRETAESLSQVYINGVFA
jgi:TetR/AcrR family acrAB operon transcriptional repressor